MPLITLNLITSIADRNRDGVLCPAGPGRPKSKKQTDSMFRASLGLSVPDDNAAFDSIKKGLREVVENHFDWHKTYTGQAKVTLELVKATVCNHIFLMSHHG